MELMMSDYISSDLPIEEKDKWATPDWLFQALNTEFDFSLDAAATIENTKCPYYITPEQDSLVISWNDVLPNHENKNVWLNPPYSRGMIPAFLNKAYQECLEHGFTVVLLIPATPDASWWPTNASEIRLITGGRISFLNPITNHPVNGNTKGSALIIFNPHHLAISSNPIVRHVNREFLKSLGQEVLNNKEAA